MTMYIELMNLNHIISSAEILEHMMKTASKNCKSVHAECALKEAAEILHTSLNRLYPALSMVVFLYSKEVEEARAEEASEPEACK